MAYSVPDLPYDYGALEPHIDEQTMRVHHDKHHQAYVDKANAALEGTEWADKDVDEVLARPRPASRRHPHRRSQQRGRAFQPQLLLADHGPRGRRRARRRPAGGDRRCLWLVRLVQGRVQDRRREPVRVRLVVARSRRLRPCRGLHGEPGLAGVRRLRRRCSASTSGSTRTTSSTRTSAPTTSTRGGTWSTGPRWPAASAPRGSPAHRAVRLPGPGRQMHRSTKNDGCLNRRMAARRTTGA